MVGFSEGYYSLVSARSLESLNSARVFYSPLEAFTVTESFYKMALAGDNKIVILGLHDLQEIKEESF